MDYVGGTGHGVGNFMNIHEGPAIRKDYGHPLVAAMDVGMIVSNEPAYYVEGDFGVRIESHLASIQSIHTGFLEFETLSRLPIDPRLIDPSLLTVDEIRWLADYHVGVLNGYAGCFDQETENWLRNIVDSYIAMRH
jgi:Xaa-Pro aminopeptidase